jgi:PAS domain S-box-containing protein
MEFHEIALDLAYFTGTAGGVTPSTVLADWLNSKPIMSMIVFGVVQVGLIIGLLVNRSRRRQSEAEATLIADISSKFVNLPPGEVDKEISGAQRRLCEFLDIDLSALWQWSDRNAGSFTATHLYSLQHGPQPQIEMSDEDFPWIRQQILLGRTVAHRSIEQMPVEATNDKDVARQLGIKSHLTLPLAVGGERPIGVLGFNTTRTERKWPDTLVKRLQLVAQIFANALARKRAELTLRESEMRLSLAAESAEAGLWELDWKTKTFWANEKAREIFGYSSEEVITMARFETVVHPDDWDRVWTSIVQSVQHGIPVEVEYRIILGGKPERWIVSRGRPFFETTGEPERLLGLSMDITVRKSAEEKLHQLSLAVEQSPVLVVITDLKGRIIYVNRKFSEVSGYSPMECLGRNPSLLKSGECPPSIYKELWACITSGNTWRGEFHNRKKNGELYWENAVISPVLDATGKITHYVGVKEDITEQKWTVEALRASESRLAAGSDLAGLGYYEVDYAEGTCFLDDRFRDICGIPPEVNQGLDPVKYWQEHIHFEDSQLLKEERQRLHTGKVDRIAVEYRYLHPAKGQRWLHHSACIAKPIDEGLGICTFGVICDITLRKQAELEAHDLRNNLMHLSRVNTLGALSGSLAHELNQPLGIILSNAQAAQELLAQEPPDVAEVQDILADIVSADRRAGGVIDQMRVMLKRGQISLQPVPLNQIIVEVLHLIRADLIRRGVTVLPELASDLPLIAGDKVQLQQLVINLLLNAADAMANNAPNARRIHLQTMLHEGRVRTSVRDEGHGLPTDAERVFQAFYTTKDQGLGLGLAICWSIVAGHHGRLWAEPHTERGAVFFFELPTAGDPLKP